MGNMMDLNNYANLSGFSPATLFCWAKTPSEEDRYDCQHQNKGIHRLTTKPDLRLIKRQISVLRENARSFSAIVLQRRCGMSSRMSSCGMSSRMSNV